MNRTVRRRIVWTVTSVAACLLAAATVVLGIVGIPAAVAGGAQVSVCGVRIGVLEVGETADLGWGEERATLSIGERVRVAPWCVLEVAGIERGDANGDGGGRVELVWRIW